VKLLYSLLLLLCANAALADGYDITWGKVGVEGTYYFSRIVPHTKRFKPDVTEFTHCAEIAFFVQTLGKREWSRKMKFPEIGGAIHISRFGNNEIFGNAIGAMATAKFWMVRSERVDAYFRLGAGAAYITKRYNANDNAINNVIGSHLNSMIHLKLGIDIRLLKNLALSLSGGLSHQSNGGMQQPNLGINALFAGVGIRYWIGNKPYLYSREGWTKKLFRPNEFIFKSAVGFTELGGIGGPKYPVYSNTFAYARYTSIINKVWIGTTLEYNQAMHDFMAIIGDGTAKDRVKNSFNLSFFVADEVLIGRVGAFFAIGAYARKMKFDIAPIYAKLGANYYFVDLGKNKTIRPFIGASLKTHYFTAQYFEFGGGIAFR
jgi:hypothetical protein